VSHEWLSEVVFYELWKHGGAAALIVFSAIDYDRRLHAALSALPVEETALGSGRDRSGRAGAAPSWGVRPQMFTFTLASLLLWLVEAW
jgi:hypothetical protein